MMQWKMKIGRFWMNLAKNLEVLERYVIMSLGYECKAMKQRKLCFVALLFKNVEAI